MKKSLAIAFCVANVVLSWDLLDFNCLLWSNDANLSWANFYFQQAMNMKGVGMMMNQSQNL